MVRLRRTPPADMGPMLRAARGDRSRRSTAQAAGIDQSYLARLERGERVPSATVARVLADVLVLSDDDRARLLAVAVDDAGRDWAAPPRF